MMKDKAGTIRINSRGQVRLPPWVRLTWGVKPGNAIEIVCSGDGNVVMKTVLKRSFAGSMRERIESARGAAQIHWRTDELMKLFRGK